MAIGALIPILLQYGIPAGIEGVKFLKELIEKMNNNPNMTQAEFEAEWAEMKTRYKAAGNKWEDAGKSPNAKA